MSKIQTTKLPRYNGSLAEWVMQLRLEIFIDQAQAGRFFHINHGSISRYEKNETIPPPGYVASLILLNIDKLKLEKGNSRINVNAPEQEYRDNLFNDIKTVIRECKALKKKDYKSQKVFADWGELEESAYTYLEKRGVAFTTTNIHEPSLPSVDTNKIDDPPIDRPPKVENIVGRQKLLKDLITLLTPGKKITLVGPVYIGKTTLAYQLVQRLAPLDMPPAQFPGGIIYCDFGYQPKSEATLKYIATRCRQSADPEYYEARLALQEKTRLIILDHADEAEDLKAIIDICDNCAVLIIQRNYAVLHGIPKEVEPLTLEEAVSLLKVWAKPQSVDDDTATRICKFYGYHPMEIVHAGRFMSTTNESAVDYLSHLHTSTYTDVLKQKRPDKNIAAVLDYYWKQMSEKTQLAIKVMAAIGYTPIKQEALASALAISIPKLRRLLAEEGYGIIVQRREDTYQISHLLYHQYFKENIND